MSIDQTAAYKINLAIDILGVNATLKINVLCDIRVSRPLSPYYGPRAIVMQNSKMLV